MDKGQFTAIEKLMNNNDDNDGAVGDDVGATTAGAVVTAKNIPELTNNDTVATNISTTHAIKLPLRGKETNDKKIDLKNIQEPDTEELLGSVTTYNCHGTRTSARVIQKMLQDQHRPVTPPHNEREPSARKDERSAAQKTPSQVRANRPTWSNVERNHFFDALNEFGKDFEAIGNFINAKLKRRSPATDISFKSKDQVRQHYYQTYHKICKYIRFSEEVRKPVQELYALINYGEMRRKLQFVTDKHFMKLRNLIYQGHISVRCKGKNIRIKTPSCKALRRLNQLDDSLEDIRLPSKIEVIVSPANMEAFGRVQTIAQNPRCRTTVPLHKKLVNFIKTFEFKWRSIDARIAEEAKLLHSQETCANAQQPQQHMGTSSTLSDLRVQDSEICFLPKPGVPIHRPLLSITEYLSSVNICLTAYEERIGVKSKGENLIAADRCNTSTSSLQTSSHTNISTAPKRLRCESGSEKKSPDQTKKNKHLENSYENLLNTAEEAHESDPFNSAKTESSGDELSDEIHDLLTDLNEINTSKEYLVAPNGLAQATEISSPSSAQNNAEIANSNCIPPQVNTAAAAVAVARSKRTSGNKATRSAFKPLLNDDIIQRIRSGWTSSTADDITIGDLYVVFGHDSKLELNYYWLSDSKDINYKPLTKSESHENILFLKQNSIKQTHTAEDCTLHSSVQSSNLSNKLKQLLLVASLSERMRRRPCICDRNNAAKVKFERDNSGRTFIANKTALNNCKLSTNDNNSSRNIFRQPMIPVRRTSIDPVKQLTTLTRQKMSRQILVQRLLLPGNSSVVVSTTNQSNSNVKQNLACETTGTLSKTPSLTTETTLANGNSNKVPLNNTYNYNPQSSAATADAIFTTAPNQNYQNSSDTCNNATFLNALARNDFNELTNTSTTQMHQQQNYIDVQDQIQHKTVDNDGPSSVNSVDSAYDESSNQSFLNGLTPMHLLRETSSNSKWLDDNINDFSLTSLLGHLDEINASRDILDPSSNLSVISESSVDYMHKFQEIKALLQNQEND